MSDVFISYASSDRQLAQAMADDLKARGVDVWWDVELVGGMQFRDAIEERLKAARIVIVIWSPAAAASRFVIDEADVAAAMGKLVSVLAPGFSIQSAPLGFRTFQAVPLGDHLALERALQRLGLVFARPETTTIEAPIDLSVREEEAWKFVLAKRDPKLVEDFLKQYPGSKYVTDAEVRRKLLAKDDKATGIASVVALAAAAATWFYFGFWYALGAFFAVGVPLLGLVQAVMGSPETKLKDQEKKST